MTICWGARLTRWAPSCSARGEQSPLTRNDLICCRALGLLCGLFCGFRLHPFQNILHALQTLASQGKPEVRSDTNRPLLLVTHHDTAKKF